jgi:hypothetical protein
VKKPKFGMIAAAPAPASVWKKRRRLTMWSNVWQE